MSVILLCFCLSSVLDAAVDAMSCRSKLSALLCTLFGIMGSTSTDMGRTYVLVAACAYFIPWLRRASC